LIYFSWNFIGFRDKLLSDSVYLTSSLFKNYFGCSEAIELNLEVYLSMKFYAGIWLGLWPG
jgi:hypothetical protein